MPILGPLDGNVQTARSCPERCQLWTEAEIRSRCERLTSAISSPWVVLSSGVDPDHLPRAVEWACKGGASGFLAGRAGWRGTIGAPDVEAALRGDALERMKRLCDVVDRLRG